MSFNITTLSYPTFEVSTGSITEHESTDDSIIWNNLTLSELIFKCCQLTLWLLGSVGNILSFMFFTQKEFSTTSTGVLFQSLALCDFVVVQEHIEALFLFVGLPNAMAHSSFVCRVRLWIIVSARLSAAWVLVSIGCERLICVVWPYKIKTLFSRRRCKMCVALLVCCSCLIAVPQLLTSESVGLYNTTAHLLIKWCTPHNIGLVGYYMWHIETWVFFTLYSALPFLTLITINTAIIIALRRANKKRQILQSRTSNASTTHSTFGSGDACHSNLNRLTSMLLFVSFTFIFLTIPWCVFILLRSLGGLDNKLEDFGGAGFLLMGINHSINFLLYILSGHTFRKQFLRMICCRSSFSCPQARVTVLMNG